MNPEQALVVDDLKPGVSWSQGLVEFIFGKEDIGVLVSPTAVICDNEKMFAYEDDIVVGCVRPEPPHEARGGAGRPPIDRSGAVGDHRVRNADRLGE